MGTLYIGEPTVFDVANLVKENSLVVFSTFHHPLNWMSMDERRVYGYEPVSMDGIINLSDFILNGHVHGAIRKPDLLQNKAYVFTSGTTYDENVSQLTSCQLIQCDISANTYGYAHGIRTGVRKISGQGIA